MRLLRGVVTRGARRSSVVVVLLALSLAAGATPAHAGGPTQLDAGALQVQVVPDPFRIRFVDTADGDVLKTLGGGGLPSPTDPQARYGGLGYSFDLRIPIVNNAYLGYYVAAEAPTVWFHARRLLGSHLDGDSLVLDVRTNDPLGHRLTVRLTPQSDGVVTVDSRIAPGSGPLAKFASVSGTAFETGPGERFLGFGERSNAVDQTGNRVFSWAEEGPFSSGRFEPILRPLLPSFTFPTGPTASNFPVPWTITTRGIGMLIDQTQRSTFRLQREDAWAAEAETNFFRFTVFAGPDPAGALRRYSSYAGRQPDPAPWFFGPWFQPTLEDSPFQLADRFRNQDVPVTVAQTYTHYLPCGAQRGHRGELREQTAGYHARGFMITTYFNPHICTTYQPVYDRAAANGFLVENRLGQPYVLSNPFTADEQVSEVDFTATGAQGFYGHLLDNALEDGYDGWMEDFGEYTPTDSVFSDGRRGLEMHNLYPVLYHCSSFAHSSASAGRELAVFIRSGWHGVQPCARVVWGGDPTEDWSCSDGLCAALHQALSIGMTGVAYWGSDIGGFHSIANPRTTDELNSRWLEFGAVSGVMRTQANGFSFRDDRARRSQVWSKDVLPIWRRYSKLRTQLLPYLEAASDAYQATGMPISRHLALVFADDPRAVRQETEFMFGPDLLAAPVIEPQARRRGVYLPAGRWVDLWRSVAYRQASGELHLRDADLLNGGDRVRLPAPLDELPLLARAGTILPLLPADVDTIAETGSGPGLVHATDRVDRMSLLAFPRGSSDAAFNHGESAHSQEAAGGWVLSIAGERVRTYDLEASMSTLENPFTPCAVELDGQPLPASDWSYDMEEAVLHATFATEDGSLVVTGC